MEKKRRPKRIRHRKEGRDEEGTLRDFFCAVDFGQSECECVSATCVMISERISLIFLFSPQLLEITGTTIPSLCEIVPYSRWTFRR